MQNFTMFQVCFLLICFGCVLGGKRSDVRRVGVTESADFKRVESTSKTAETKSNVNTYVSVNHVGFRC